MGIFEQTETECSHCGAKFYDSILGTAEEQVLRHLDVVHGIRGTPRVVPGSVRHYGGKARRKGKK